MKLQSMTDFVLQNKANFKGYKDEDYGKFAYNHVVRLENYANFLKQPLTLGMFVPCDEEGNVLEEPDFFDGSYGDNGFGDVDKIRYKRDFKEYQQAKERILFEGFSFKSKDNFKEWCEDNNVTNVESMVGLCFTLTPNAIKQIGL